MAVFADLLYSVAITKMVPDHIWAVPKKFGPQEIWSTRYWAPRNLGPEKFGPRGIYPLMKITRMHYTAFSCRDQHFWGPNFLETKKLRGPKHKCDRGPFQL